MLPRRPLEATSPHISSWRMQPIRIPTAPPIEEMMKWAAPDPGKAFDNLYFVGSRWVSAWALVTDAGIILIDTMDNDQEAEQLIEGGMRTLGLDPADIRIILDTHG